MFRTNAAPAGREWLLERLEAGPPLIAPGAFDAVSGRLIEQRGFEAIYCGGYAAVASAFGHPDLGLAGMTDMLSVYGRVRGATRVPMIVDADTGYGGPLNVARTVCELASLGVSAIQIEDQVNPKQCGHLDRKEVVPIPEATRRIQAAVRTTGDAGPAIIARTDALAPEGIASAIERANRYFAAGAAVVLVDAMRGREEMEQIRAAVDGPLMFNAASTGKGPVLPAAELAELGYSLIVYPIEALYAAYGAMRSMLDVLHAGELVPEQGEWRRPTFDEVNDFLGFHAMLDWEREMAEVSVEPVAQAVGSASAGGGEETDGTV